MASHTTYRGSTIDMDSIRRENEKTPAMGNMKVNARGDQLGKNGSILVSVDQVARAANGVPAAVIQSGLKGPLPDSVDVSVEKISKPSTIKQQPPGKQVKHKELPNGDIVEE